MINQSSIKYISSLLSRPDSISDGDHSSIALFRQTFPYFVPARYIQAAEHNKKSPYSQKMMGEIQPYMGNWLLFCNFLEAGSKTTKPGQEPINRDIKFEQKAPGPLSAMVKAVDKKDTIVAPQPVAAPQNEADVPPVVIPEVPSFATSSAEATAVDKKATAGEKVEPVKPVVAAVVPPVVIPEVPSFATSSVEATAVDKKATADEKVEPVKPVVAAVVPPVVIPEVPSFATSSAEATAVDKKATAGEKAEPVKAVVAEVVPPVKVVEPEMKVPPRMVPPVAAEMPASAEATAGEKAKVIPVVSETPVHAVEKPEFITKLVPTKVVVKKQIEVAEEVSPVPVAKAADTSLVPDGGAAEFAEEIRADEEKDTLIQPVYTEDYFLQQGVKVSIEIPDEIEELKEVIEIEDDEDKSLMVMMSFSEWLLHFKNTAEKQKDEKKDQRALKTMWQKEKLAAAMEEENEEIPENVFEMAVNSITREDGLASESLADIYIKQGKYDQAIEMYRKLSLRNPKKNAYFARRIEEVLKEKQS